MLSGMNLLGQVSKERGLYEACGAADGAVSDVRTARRRGLRQALGVADFVNFQLFNSTLWFIYTILYLLLTAFSGSSLS